MKLAAMLNKQDPPRRWGLLPEQVKTIVRKREWDRVLSVKARLTGKKIFPVKIMLKPPTGAQATQDLQHFQTFVQAWKVFPEQHMLRWEQRNYRTLSLQRVPIALICNSIQELYSLIGDDAIAKSAKWYKNMLPILALSKDLYPVLVKHLAIIDKVTIDEARLLAKLIPQLKPKMGKGCYLRAIPLEGVDTKFLERYSNILIDILNVIYPEHASEQACLTSWLDCEPIPKGWITIRALCDVITQHLGGLSLFQLPWNTLFKVPLNASHILVVENLQSGLALPKMKDTIAVIGGGKNIAWMQAAWLHTKHVAYWGDIDTWGLSILSDVRSLIKHVQPLMMDRETLLMHQDRMVEELEPVKKCPTFLTEDEKLLFVDLSQKKFNGTRLEQERISANIISDSLSQWLSGLDAKG